MNYTEDDSPTYQQAMKQPVARTFVPDYTIEGPTRRKRNRRHLFLTLAVLGALILARLVLRHFFPEVFA